MHLHLFIIILLIIRAYVSMTMVLHSNLFILQSLLRGRFLRNGGPDEERPPSVAAQELGQLRQRHPVSGLR